MLDRWLGSCLMLLLCNCSAAAPSDKRAPSAASGGIRDKAAYGIALYFLRDPGNGALTALQKHVKATHFTIVGDGASAGHREAGATVRFSEPKLADMQLSADMLEHFGRGLTSDEKRRLQDVVAVDTLRFWYSAADVSIGLAEADKLAAAVAGDTGAYLFDSETRELFTIAAWRQLRLAAWQGSAPKVAKHTIMHAYENGAGYRAVSLGMIKLGLPDVAVNDFDGAEFDRVGELMTLTMQALGGSGALTNKGEIAVKSRGATLLVPLVWSKRDEGDADNRLLEVAFGGASASRREQMKRLLDQIDHIDGVSDADVEIAAAIAKVQTRLAELKVRFARGLGAGEHLHIKASFDAGANGHEAMWIDVLTWKGAEISGTLLNHPRFIPKLAAGKTVSVLERDVVDYALRGAAGNAVEGPFLDALIERNAVAKGR